MTRQTPTGLSGTSAPNEPSRSGSPLPFCEKALRNLAKKVRGYPTREIKTIYEYTADGEKRIKSETVVRKSVPPDLAAITFTLTNLDPEHWSAKPAATGQPFAELPQADLSRLSEEALRELSGLGEEL